MRARVLEREHTYLAERDEEERHLGDELAELRLGDAVPLDGEHPGADLLDGSAGLGQEVVRGAGLGVRGGGRRLSRCLDVHGYRRRLRRHGFGRRGERTPVAWSGRSGSERVELWVCLTLEVSQNIIKWAEQGIRVELHLTRIRRDLSPQGPL